MPTIDHRSVITPTDTGAALENPGMGWVLHYYDNGLDAYGARLDSNDTVDDFPGLMVAYFRLPWAHIEPNEGVFNWSVVDAPAQRWIRVGKQVAFRFTCGEWSTATPDWVFAAGARAVRFTPGIGVTEDGEAHEPDYDDPIFLDKLNNFLATAAARYDGNSHVAFIDVGSFGVWGEGHTFWSSKLPYSAETVKHHVDLYMRHFTRTPVLANHTWSHHGRGPGGVDYACERGLGYRTDSILVLLGDELYHPGEATPFWPHTPVVLESQHYGMSVRDGVWGDGEGYLQAVEEYHGSYISIHWWPREFLEANKTLVERINRRLGYRLQLIEASWPAYVVRNVPAVFEARWQNTGVAPCLPGGFVALTLKDEHSGIVGVCVDEQFDVRNLPVLGRDSTETTEQQYQFTLPINLAPGTYTMYVSIGTRTGTPRIQLPLPSDDNERRYHLGMVSVA